MTDLDDKDLEKLSQEQTCPCVIQNDQKRLICCPCGGGQSCIVDRRSFGAFVYEDYVLNEAKISLRKHCFSEPTEEQNKAMNDWLNKNNNPNSVVIDTQSK